MIKHNVDAEGHRPVKVPSQGIPAHLQKDVIKEIDRLLGRNAIRPLSSPWSSCIVVVRKINWKNQAVPQCASGECWL